MIFIDRTSEASDCVCNALDGVDYVSRLEREITAKLGKHAVATSSSDGALLAALHLCGARIGDYVFLPSFSFYSNASTIEYSGFVPVFIDCDPVTRCMSESALETALLWAELQEKSPAAVVIDDAFGSIPDYDRLLPLCASHGIPTVELACDALGGKHSRPCGANCDYGVISFVKRLNGGGGALLCPRDEIAKAKRFVRAEYSDGENHDYKMHNMIAALDYGLLAAFDKIAERAKSNAAAVSAHSERVMPAANGDAGAYLLVRTYGNKISAAFSPKRITPVHMLPQFSNAPFFEHEPSFAVCNTYRDCVLIGTDFSPILRRKLIKEING